MISEMERSRKCSQSIYLVRVDLSEQVVIKERFERQEGKSCMLSDVWENNVTSRGNISPKVGLSDV